jgi:hypothetical protein
MPNHSRVALVTGEVRNNGQEPASALLVLIGPSGAMMGEATPAP